MKSFSYVLPHNLDEANKAAKKPGALIKAAGIDVVDLLKERRIAPKELVNLLPLADQLAGIAPEADGGLRIGALTTLTQLEESAAVGNEAFAAIRQAAESPATPQVRNRATVAGNLLQVTRCWYLRDAQLDCLHGKDGPACRAQTGENRYHSIIGYHDCVRVHPSNLAPAMLAFNAEYSTVLDGKTRRRKLTELFPAEPLAELDEDTLETGEIVTALHLPAQPAGTRSAYCESREKLSFDWATTAAAVRLVIEGGTIKDASLVLGAVAPVPVPRPEAAALLIGKKPDDELFQEVATAAFSDAKPLSQNAFKVKVGKAIVREALHKASR